MFFNSINFAIFLPIVFLFYWYATKGNLKFQNILLLISSYYFYACWNWWLLFLLLFSTLLNYFTGIIIYKTETKNKKRLWFWFSIFANLAFLSVFKYYNFFAASFTDGLSLLGIKANFVTIKLVLPVGISFYTFIGLSYVIDVYNSKIKPEKNFLNYSVFISFFPLILAGPIERATHLLPQILKKREFDYTKAVDGLRQILWGLFKKIVIADNCAEFVNAIFNNYTNYSGSTLALGALLFTFQIYCDFSGYSDIALGTARLFGIDLMRNFAFPYFSRDISDFWKRWHISLSTWFRDYVFLPVVFSVSRRIKPGKLFLIKTEYIIYSIGIAITWLLVGLWHGANYTFIIWGAIHGFLLIVYHLTFKSKKRFLKNLKFNRNNKTLIFVETLLTFIIIIFTWIFFRANSASDAFIYISKIFSGSLFTAPHFPHQEKAFTVLFLTGVFMIIEWFGKEQQFAIANLGLKWHKPVRLAMYYIIVLIIIYFSGGEQQFIYFQF
jgi:alginate O-acetyltransferase complex protein AlgI